MLLEFKCAEHVLYCLNMEELLLALRSGDPTRINRCALNFLFTSDGRINRLKVQNFERYAPCRIIEWKSSAYKRRPYILSILYNNREYGIG